VTLRANSCSYITSPAPATSVRGLKLLGLKLLGLKLLGLKLLGHKLLGLKLLCICMYVYICKMLRDGVLPYELYI
jgi:hypothetical protein